MTRLKTFIQNCKDDKDEFLERLATEQRTNFKEASESEEDVDKIVLTEAQYIAYQKLQAKAQMEHGIPCDLEEERVKRQFAQVSLFTEKEEGKVGLSLKDLDCKKKYDGLIAMSNNMWLVEQNIR